MSRAISDLFEARDDGRFFYRGRQAEYVVTREEAENATKAVKRLENRLGICAFISVFAIFVTPMLLAEYAPGVPLRWLVLGVVAAVVAGLMIAGLCFRARRSRLEGLLEGTAAETARRT